MQYHVRHRLYLHKPSNSSQTQSVPVTYHALINMGIKLINLRYSNCVIMIDIYLGKTLFALRETRLF